MLTLMELTCEWLIHLRLRRYGVSSECLPITLIITGVFITCIVASSHVHVLGHLLGWSRLVTEWRLELVAWLLEQVSIWC